MTSWVRRTGLLLLAALAAGCAAQGYYLEEETDRIYVKNRWGTVTKWYEPRTQEYDEIAARFWPYLLEDPSKPSPSAQGRKARLSKLIRTLDKDQWRILLDLDLWSGKDKVDLAHLEDLERMAKAVKGLSFGEYLAMKDAAHTRSRLMDRLLQGRQAEGALAP